MYEQDFRQALYDHFLSVDKTAGRIIDSGIKIAKLVDAIISYLPPYIREDFLKTADIKEIE